MPSTEDAALPYVSGFTNLVEIGRGGTSTVYRANETDLGRPVALKVVSTTGDDARRLEREARALGSLSGVPNIVQVYRVTRTADGRPVIVMALMEDSIGGLLRQGRTFDAAAAMPWLRQVATGLDAAHAKGVAHRDVKPDNVLLDAGGTAHLADFGIAGLAELEAGSTTAMSFSPPYAPPERFVGTEADPAAGDRYSLAATWFALLTGTAPFGTATDGGVHGLIMRVVSEAPQHLELLPPELRPVFQRALAKSPEDRYPTATAFADAVGSTAAVAPTSPTGGPPGTPLPAANDSAPTAASRPGPPGPGLTGAEVAHTVARTPTGAASPGSSRPAPAPRLPPTTSIVIDAQSSHNRQWGPVLLAVAAVAAIAFGTVAWTNRTAACVARPSSVTLAPIDVAFGTVAEPVVNADLILSLACEDGSNPVSRLNGAMSNTTPGSASPSWELSDGATTMTVDSTPSDPGVVTLEVRTTVPGQPDYRGSFRLYRQDASGDTIGFRSVGG